MRVQGKSQTPKFISLRRFIGNWQVPGAKEECSKKEWAQTAQSVILWITLCSLPNLQSIFVYREICWTDKRVKKQKGDDRWLPEIKLLFWTIFSPFTSVSWSQFPSLLLSREGVSTAQTRSPGNKWYFYDMATEGFYTQAWLFFSVFSDILKCN